MFCAARIGKYLLWFLLLLLVIAIIVFVAIAASKGCGKGRCMQPIFVPKKAVVTAATDYRTDTITTTAVATGSASETGGVVVSDETGFIEVLSTCITTNCYQNALLCNVSAQSVIGTADIDLGADTPTIEMSAEVAMLQMQVLIDGELADPGTITFNEQTYILIANSMPDNMMSRFEDLVTANSFQFIARKIKPGKHKITVQARLGASATAIGALVASASAAISSRTLVVEPAYIDKCPACPSSSSSSSSSCSSPSSSSSC